ncbi:MAG TPA: ABC transporter transmembrane domain-containing protein [Bacteroidia bacterium]
MGGPKRDRDIPKAKLNFESLKQLRFVFKYIKPYKWYFYGGLMIISLSAVNTMMFPLLMGKMIGAVSGKDVSITQMPQGVSVKDLSFLKEAWPINITLLLIFVQLSFQVLLSYFRVYFLSRAGASATGDLKKELYTKLISLPMSFYSTQRVGELSSRIGTDTGQINDTLTFVFAEFLRGLMTLVFGLTAIFMISTQLAGIMLSVVPVIAIIAVVFGGRIRKMSRKESDLLADSSTVVQETLQGISVVKSFTGEELENARYGSNISNWVKYAIKTGMNRGLFVAFIIFGIFGAIGFVVWFGANLIQSGGMGIDDLVTFVIFSAFVGGTLGGFADMFGQIQKTIGATERVRELLEMDGEAYGKKMDEENKRFNGEIEFNEVEFSYPSRKEIKVLKGVSFKAEKGSQVAIVGGSGGGKSTIASLIMRFYDAEAGVISIDGKPVQSYGLNQLRKQIAYVPQDVTLFGGTIYENIIYGKPEATEEEVRQAAKKANALQFIDSFPDKFQTIVGERGIQLSGGQKQRIAIARAVIKDPAILVLDEATSALDSESELLVQEALDDLMKNRTSIVIAHRLSTIRNADRIIVLDKGMIKESGNHNELMHLENGIYKGLSQMQVML